MDNLAVARGSTIIRDPSLCIASCRGADCNSDNYLVRVKYRQHVAIYRSTGKEKAPRRYYVSRLKEKTTTQQYESELEKKLKTKQLPCPSEKTELLLNSSAYQIALQCDSWPYVDPSRIQLIQTPRTEDRDMYLSLMKEKDLQHIKMQMLSKMVKGKIPEKLK
ncbi:hypothetical protein J437_LFUL007224 [Ladona fulva]|uniref:Uncharacterized protein n=1 Tax=Ladona fulva TaxID=123851 RepID=A0A8K0K486_LADFU|nr:hypothetical protein J437_LFUL007224 [Ladona fulva]